MLKGLYLFEKRLLDITCSVAGLLLLSPLMIPIAILIRLEDGGPIFYKGERVGRNGNLFKMFKFRSMVVNADKLGPSSTSAEDPRITRIGHFLRKYKLDELPQLLNVLRGDMSIVGPRPEVKYFTDMYTEDEMIILSVKPGITDWASIWNCDEGSILAGSRDPDRAYFELIRPTKLALQMKYVKERSFWVDLKIILLTLLAVIKPEAKIIREIRHCKLPV